MKGNKQNEGDSHPHRPQFHFTPLRNWMNDPNGLVYLDGIYHLFYQHNPHDNVWGDIHWGHATSTDLVRWTHEPLALRPDAEGLGLVASGCAVVDGANASGLQTGLRPVVVAIFTHFTPDDRQVQSLAYSNDGGRRWVMFADNPVLEDPECPDFRDPKVFWHGPSKHWVMVLAVKDHIRFYTSNDLRDWQYQHRFDHARAARDGVWECPDLFEVEYEGRSCWILLISVQAGGPNDGSSTQYFIGSFDGVRFEADPLEYPLWLDYGPDNYAAVTWSNTPGDQKVLIGWMSNWLYADKVPTDAWRGSMTVPRTVSVRNIAGKHRLANRPVPGVNSLRTGDREALRPNTEVVLPTDLVDIEAHFDGTRSTCIEVRSEADDLLRIEWAPARGQVVIDRRKAVGSSAFLAREISVPVVESNGPRTRVRVLLDRSSVEVFVQDGVASGSALLFPVRPLNRFTLRCDSSTDASATLFLLRCTGA